MLAGGYVKTWIFKGWFGVRVNIKANSSVLGVRERHYGGTV
jgi:hypothetical protein